jgi:MSHA biogenesis protein MshG
MPRYRWTGHAATGATQGQLEAATPGAVADLLQGRGITPLTIQLESGSARPTSRPAPAGASGATGQAGSGIDWPALQRRLLPRPKVGAQDLMLFSRQLNTLLRSGVPILRALAGLQDSTSNEALQSTLGEVRLSLESGIELSTSLARHGQVFNAFYIALVRVGEMTGRLDEIFLRLFKHLEFETAMRQQVKAALRYPSFVIAAMAVALGVINLMVIPAFATVFEQSGAALPLPTRILMWSSRFTIDWGWAMGLAGVAGVVALQRWRATPTGRLRWDALMLRIPVAGKIVRKAVLARFARSFALSLRSGVPIAEALTVVAQTVDNAHIALKVDGMRSSVERGESILRAAAASGVFTPVVLQMIAVGEETGAIDELMDEVAELYGNEVEYELKTLGQQIEPLLIVMLGALVLLLALGVFLPIWNLGRTVMAH